MKFTTHFGLQSQTTRLAKKTIQDRRTQVKDGILTLYDTLFQKIYTCVAGDRNLDRLQFATCVCVEIFSLSSSRFTRRYWGNPC